MNRFDLFERDSDNRAESAFLPAENTFSLEKISPANGPQKILELEASLANLSFAHAYALEDLKRVSMDWQKEEQILDEISTYQQNYFEVRKVLALLNEERVEKLEADLLRQKQLFFCQHNA